MIVYPIDLDCEIVNRLIISNWSNPDFTHWLIISDSLNIDHVLPQCLSSWLLLVCTAGHCQEFLSALYVTKTYYGHWPATLLIMGNNKERGLLFCWTCNAVVTVLLENANESEKSKIKAYLTEHFRLFSMHLFCCCFSKLATVPHLELTMGASLG